MRALLAWELGDNFGHIGKIVQIGNALVGRGVDVYMALQNPIKAASFLGDSKIKLLQSPYGRIRPKPRGGEPVRILSYADDVSLCGYDRADELAMLVKSWETIFDLVSPDLLLANSAPTALLAAHDRPFKKVSFGIGYEVPPMTVPLQPLRFWEPAHTDELVKQEIGVLGVINEAMKLLGRPHFETFRDILNVDAAYITAFTELDHYPDRPQPANYIGPFFVGDKGHEWKWNPDLKDRKRIFAYLYPGRPAFESVLTALKTMEQDTILSAPGLPKAIVDKFTTPYLRISAEPLKLETLAPEADLCITHGGLGTVVQFLLKGVPQLLFPNHIEQMMIAKRLEHQDLGRRGPPKASPEDAGKFIGAMLADRDIQAVARAFAMRHSDFKLSDQSGKFADAVMTLLNSSL